MTRVKFYRSNNNNEEPVYEFIPNSNQRMNFANLRSVVYEQLALATIVPSDGIRDISRKLFPNYFFPNTNIWRYRKTHAAIKSDEEVPNFASDENACIEIIISREAQNNDRDNYKPDYQREPLREYAKLCDTAFERLIRMKQEQIKVDYLQDQAEREAGFKAWIGMAHPSIQSIAQAFRRGYHSSIMLEELICMENHQRLVPNLMLAALKRERELSEVPPELPKPRTQNQSSASPHQATIPLVSTLYAAPSSPQKNCPAHQQAADEHRRCCTWLRW